uniref:hypothetical protein n=1 Tax=Halomonas sp. TaxID=1486246 RepID=UPI0025B83E78
VRIALVLRPGRPGQPQLYLLPGALRDAQLGDLQVVLHLGGALLMQRQDGRQIAARLGALPRASE